MSSRDDELIEEARRWAEEAGPDDDATVAVTRPPPSRPSIPAEIGPLRIVRKIGRGGMGEVWLGRHSLLARDVAVKFLLNVVEGPDDSHFERFLQEARTAASVRHPHLVVVHDAEMVGQVPCLVMEYIDGPTLAAVLQERGAVELCVMLAALEAVAAAVGELHERGIVHRDIKPSNILLARDGRVVVSDFGLACVRTPFGGGASLAGFAGTPCYMAPEMFEGAASPRSDVYALGITAFQMLTGELPFTGTVEQIRRMHQSEPLPVEMLNCRDVDGAVVDVISRATNKNATFRYKSAAHMLRALKEAVPDARIWSRGAAELASEAARYRQAPVTDIAIESKTPSSTSYYEHLASIAATKRQGQTGRTTEKAAPPSPSPATDFVGSSTHRDDHSEPNASIANTTRGLAPTERGIDQRRRRDILALKKCPRCDYSLEGLPRRYRCPECGFEYDESMFVLYGWSRKGDRPNFFRTTVGTTSPVLGFIIFGVLLSAIVASAIRGKWQTAITIGIAWAAGTGQWLWRRGVHRRHGGSVQFAFSSLGASRRRGPGPPEFLPWSEFRRIAFRRAGRDVWRLRLTRGRWQLVRRSMTRTLTGRPWIEGVIECSRREAATLRGEIRRRLRASQRMNK